MNFFVRKQTQNIPGMNIFFSTFFKITLIKQNYQTRELKTVEKNQQSHFLYEIIKEQERERERGREKRKKERKLIYLVMMYRYLIHEAVGWNVIDKEWIFLPRRKSEEEYNDILDEERGANVMLIVSEDFNRFEMKTIGVFNHKSNYSLSSLFCCNIMTNIRLEDSWLIVIYI